LAISAGFIARFVFAFDKARERERYYLLPGMGGKAVRRKQKMMLLWGILAGVVVSVVVGYLFYTFGRIAG